jgi:outer membrane protein OmpA-like peptidoglycan-associated protein
MRHAIIQKLAVLLALACFFVVYGCAVAIIGVGAGIGTAAYVTGKSTKTYESGYHKTIQASSDTLEKLKIPVSEKISDELKTVIKANRPDGTPITLEVVSIEQNLTKVSVRTGAVGVWDRRVSTQVQDFISAKLIGGAGAATTNQEIIEEDLDDNSAQHRPYAESTPEHRDQIQTSSLPKLGELLADSVFIIYFSQNSNNLSQKAMEKLDRVADIILKNPNAEITLNGYSDSTGASSYNEMISEIRANAVKLYLVGKGAGPHKITVLGHGSQKFLATNKTEEGRQLNRRVEIELSNMGTK